MESNPKLKRCSKCGETKPFSEFYKNKTWKDGLSWWCKKCDDKSNTKWRKKHPDLHVAYGKKWSKEHPEQVRKAARIRRINNPEPLKSSARKSAKKRRSTPSGKINHRMGVSILRALKNNKAGRNWESLVGYSMEELRAHLESLFTDSMTWDAFMRGEIHIDHIAPKSRFQYDSPEDPEFKVCWSLSNLQPMWAKDNNSKYAKTPEEWKQYKTQRVALGA